MSKKRPFLIGAAVLGAGAAAAYAATKLRELHSRRKHREDTFPLGSALRRSPGVSQMPVNCKFIRGQRVCGPGVGVGDSDSAVGVMAQAVRDGAFTQPGFSDVQMGDLTLSVGNDALKKDGLRLMVSWPETVEIAKSHGWIAPSKAIADAIYAAAPVKTAFHSLVTASDPESGGAKMHTMAFAQKYNDDVNKQLVAKNWDSTMLQSGAEKYWILSPRLAETVKATGAPAAVNYGGWDANGKPLQSPGAMHDINYPGDYSQLYRPIMRYATDSQGNQVDLLKWMVENDSVPQHFADMFDDGEPPPSPVASEFVADSQDAEGDVSSIVEDVKNWFEEFFS